MNRAVFLDRDGTINVDTGYTYQIEGFKFIKGVFAALRKLSKTDFKSIVITDQSGIGRGYYAKEDTEKIHGYMLRELSKRGIRIDKIYYCPHAPEKGCHCRKPGTLLIRRAAKEFDLNLPKCYFVGDKTKDIQAGKNAGCKTILVMTGKAGKDHEFAVKPDFKAHNLLEAVNYVLKNERQD
jgi:D,D-heptose 1,7-bisphosphate phosphatase